MGIEFAIENFSELPTKDSESGYKYTIKDLKFWSQYGYANTLSTLDYIRVVYCHQCYIDI